MSRLKSFQKVGTDNKIDLAGSEGLEGMNVGNIKPIPVGHFVIVLGAGLQERRILR